MTGVDIATNLVEHARAEAEREGVEVTFDEGDAEDLPYGDGSFDVVVSLIGAMFAPRPERVAAELLRVCRPGGRILMANWTPRSFVGDMFRAIDNSVWATFMTESLDLVHLVAGDDAGQARRLGAPRVAGPVRPEAPAHRDAEEPRHLARLGLVAAAGVRPRAPPE